MSIEFACPVCAKTYRVKDELAGKSAKCKCGQTIEIPPQPEPESDLSDLFEEEAQAAAPALAPSKPSKTQLSDKERTEKAKETLQNAAEILSGYGLGLYAPFNKYLGNTGSALVKIAIGAIVGAIAGAQGIAREDSVKIDPTLMILATAAIGAGAASLLVVADIVGKRSPAARWATLITVIFLIAAGVVAYFLFDTVHMDRGRSRHSQNNFTAWP